MKNVGMDDLDSDIESIQVEHRGEVQLLRKIET